MLEQRIMNRRNSFPIYLGWLLVALTATSSCSKGPEPVLYEYRSVSEEGWQKTDTVSFVLPELGVDGPYTAHVSVRTQASFSYRSIWLGVRWRLHHPDTLFLDTVECVIQEQDKRSEPSGIHLRLTEVGLPGKRLQAGQEGEVDVYHLMRREFLPDVCQVGIRIVPGSKNP